MCVFEKIHFSWFFSGNFDLNCFSCSCTLNSLNNQWSLDNKVSVCFLDYILHIHINLFTDHLNSLQSINTNL